MCLGKSLKDSSLAVSLLNQGYEHRMKRKINEINETETFGEEHVDLLFANKIPRKKGIKVTMLKIIRIRVSVLLEVLTPNLTYFTDYTLWRAGEVTGF